MNPKQSENDLLPLLLKGAGLVLVGILALLGLIGLVLPVIPGIMFLFLAALLLAKISSRFDSLLNSNSQMRHWRSRWDRSSSLPLVQRVKLSFWVLARAVVNGVEAAANSLNKVRAEN